MLSAFLTTVQDSMAFSASGSLELLELSSPQAMKISTKPIIHENLLMNFINPSLFSYFFP